MKRTRTLLLCSAIIIGSFPILINSTAEVQAKTDYTYYPMSCNAGEYETDYVADDGTFAKKGCYSNYSEAVQAMYQLGNDGVVRHSESYSPTKVIAMTSGVVYSYPQRAKSNTAIINQYTYTTANMKATYVTVHREMAYFGTETYNGDGTGKIHINLTGFDGYIDLTVCDLVPMKFITNSLPLYLGGNSTYDNEAPFYTHIYQGYYTVVQNGNYKDLVYHCFSGWSKNTWPDEWTMTVGPAAEWMTVGSTYYSYNGYDFYADRQYSSKTGTYYNYYQFSPLRTKSNVSASTYNAFLSSRGYSSSSKLWDAGQYFINGQNTYGVNATLVFAMACLESGYGRSPYALERNNLFGWGAYDSDPNQAATFASIETGIYEHMGLNLRGYLDINDYRYFGGQLGNKGSGLNVKYAGDPYWGMKIAAIAYAIDKADNNSDGTLTDCDTASLGVINTYGVNITKTAGGSALYNSAYGATYQKNHIVSILGSTGDYYKIQSTSYMSNGSVASIQSVGYLTYDWQNFIGYLPKSYVDRINSTAANDTGTVPTGDYIFSAALSYKNNALVLSGTAYRPGIYVNDANTVTQKLTATNELFAKTDLPIVSTVKNNDQVAFSADTSTLMKLDYGTYYFKFSSVYSSYSEYGYDSYIKSTDIASIPADQTIAGKVYHFEADENGLLKLVISKETVPETPAATPTPTPTATPTPTPTASASTAVKLLQGLDSIAYDQENNTDTSVLRIKGMAFLSDMDAPADSADVKIELSFYNMETGTSIPMKTAVSNASKAISYIDGKDHTRIMYEASYDASQLPEGQYIIKVTVTNGKTVKTAQLIDQQQDIYPADQIHDGIKIRILKNSVYSYRYEISVEKNNIDFSLINKPTVRSSGYGVDKMSLASGHLTMVGTSWIYQVGFASADNPVSKMLLVAADGTVYSYDAVNKACTVDYTKILNTKYNMDNVCYTLDADLTNLAKGSYTIYWQLASQTDKYDVFKANNYFSTKTDNVTYNGITYSISTNDEDGTMTLTIK